MPEFNTITQPAASGGYQSISKIPTVSNGVDSWGNAEPDSINMAGYDEFIKKLNEDTTGKYIGAVPKAAQTKPATEAQPLSTIQDVAGAAGNMVSNLSQTEAVYSRDQYETDLRAAQERGAYWFDPNADLRPDIDKYIAELPKSTDSLTAGSPIARLGQNQNAAGNTASSILINPSGFKVKNKVASNILNPLNLFDKSQGNGFANYVGSRAAAGAMGGIGGGSGGGLGSMFGKGGSSAAGSSGGSSGGGGFGAGMIAGGIIGMVEGIFSWKSAQAEDAKVAKDARKKYEVVLQEWTINKNKRIVAQREQRYADINTNNENAKITAENENTKKAARILANRKRIVDVISNAGKVTEETRSKRLARWGK